jgi:hypothetical protein
MKLYHDYNKMGLKLPKILNKIDIIISIFRYELIINKGILYIFYYEPLNIKW